jgi:hypothetical protein
MAPSSFRAITTQLGFQIVAAGTSPRVPSGLCKTRSDGGLVFLVDAAHDDLERVIGQGTL